MSSQLSILSYIEDLTAVKRFLYPDLCIAQQQSPDASQWSHVWDWDIDNSMKNTSTSHSGHNVENSEAINRKMDKWLQTSIVSLSPTCDVIVIANKNRVCFLTQKLDHRSQKKADTVMSVSWQSIVSQTEGEFITDVVCLPLASRKRSNQEFPDWTCVVIGFSSGHLRMYTETGVLLLSQQLHNESVQRLKWQEELYSEKCGVLFIFHKTTLVSIDGFQLLQVLPSCRSKAARDTAIGKSSLQDVSLTYEKLEFSTHESIKDCISCGVKCSSVFDQMRKASMLDVFSTVQLNPPAVSVYLSSGIAPYVCFSHVTKGFSHTFSSLASAMKGIARSLFTSRMHANHHIVPGTPVNLQFCLSDEYRIGEKICLSPCRGYAAISDNHGRIVLLDIEQGLAVRILKGYRDAQLAWVQVEENPSGKPKQSRHCRSAQFLVIYAPRFGVLDVWLSIHGPKVAAFTVSMHAVLLSPTYGMISQSSRRFSASSIPRCSLCALLDVDGSVSTLDIPFHLALSYSDKSRKMVEDMALLKKIRSTLKEATVISESLVAAVKKLFFSINIAGFRFQAFQCILGTPYLTVDFLQGIVQECISRLMANVCNVQENLDPDCKKLLRFACMQSDLLKTYSRILQIPLHNPEISKNGDHFAQSLQSCLDMRQKDAEHVAEQIVAYCSEKGVWTVDRVECWTEKSPLLPAVSFLHCFPPQSEEIVTGSGTALTGVSLHGYKAEDVSDEKVLDLASFLFADSVQRRCKAEDIFPILQDSGIAPDLLLSLLLMYCLSQDYLDLLSLPTLTYLFTEITCLANISDVVVDHNCVSPWWQQVHSCCRSSKQNMAAFVIALVCFNVAHSFKASKAAKSGAPATPFTDDFAEEASLYGYSNGNIKLDKDDDKWVNLYLDMSHWELLIEQLEDTLALSTLLMIRVPPELAVNESRLFQSIAVDESAVTLEWHCGTQSGGDDRDCSSADLRNSDDCGDDAVGHLPLETHQPDWSQGGNPDPITFSVASLLGGGKGCITELVARYISSNRLRPLQFLHSIPRSPGCAEVILPEQDDSDLNGDSIASLKIHLEALSKRFPSSLESDILLANCSWEYVVAWNKDVEDIELLKIAMRHLELVSNHIFRQEVSRLMWHMFIVSRVETAALLMEEVGKAPKNRLCYESLNMSTEAVRDFIYEVAMLLTIMMESSQLVDDRPVFDIEPNWAAVRGSASLAELAASGKPTNYGHVCLHRLLVIVMYGVLTFGMKSVSVLSLFDRKDRDALFKDLQSYPFLPKRYVDRCLNEKRKQVIMSMITKSIEALGEPACVPIVDTGYVLGENVTSPFYCTRFMTAISRDFGTDIDCTILHCAVELYYCGHDSQAQLLHGHIGDLYQFGHQMLSVLGCRLAYHLFVRHRSMRPQLLATLMPCVTSWLQSLVPNLQRLRYKHSTTAENMNLLSECIHRLPQDSRQYMLAMELVPFLEHMASMMCEMKTESVEHETSDFPE